MQKPNEWDTTPAARGGQNPRPNAGGYVLGVVRVGEEKSREGAEMITLFLDVARGPFKNYYRDLGERLKKDCYLRYYQLTQGEKSIPFFKGMITSFEESNPGFDWQWVPQSLVRRIVGANLREEEYRNKQGQNRLGLKIAYLCSVESVEKGLPILEPKLLTGSFSGDQQQSTQPPVNDDLPF